MPLDGEAKKAYQREYMRRKRKTWAEVRDSRPKPPGHEERVEGIKREMETQPAGKGVPRKRYEVTAHHVPQDVEVKDGVRTIRRTRLVSVAVRSPGKTQSTPEAALAEALEVGHVQVVVTDLSRAIAAMTQQQRDLLLGRMATLTKAVTKKR